jgi:hypothetical protein
MLAQTRRANFRVGEFLILLVTQAPKPKPLDEDRLNGPSAQADFAYWSMMPRWTLDEAIALSFGKAPEQVNWSTVEPQIDALPFAAEYGRRRELVMRCVTSQDLFDPIMPTVFLGWAISTGLSVPSGLVSAIEARGFEMINWKSRYETLLRELEVEKQERSGLELQIEVLSWELAQQKKEIGTRERETLLKLIIGMAIAGYTYNPKGPRSKVPSEIAGDLAKQGMNIDDDTVRKWLRQAAELLPPKEQ